MGGRKRRKMSEVTATAATVVTTDISRKAMAMQTNLVLDLIAKKLPTTDALRSLRGTCKTWNRSFVAEIHRSDPGKEFSKNSIGTIVELKPAAAGQSNPPPRYNERVKLMKDFTNLMRSSLQIPYSAYKIYDIHLRDLRVRYYKDFLNVCGNAIKHLTLDCLWDRDDKDVQIDRIREVIFMLAPNLTHLSLILDTQSDSAMETNRDGTPLTGNKKRRIQRSNSYPGELHILQLQALNVECRTIGLQPTHKKLLADLFKYSPALEHLALDSAETINSPDINVDILSILRGSMQNLGNLKTLRAYQFGLGLEELGILAELGSQLRLQTLVISVWHGHIITGLQQLADKFYEFLVTQAVSLCEFQLDICIYTGEGSLPGTDERDQMDHILLRIPHLGHLRFFGFRRLTDGLMRVQYDGGILANTFPHLEKLGYELRTPPPPFVNHGHDSLREVYMDDLSHMSHNGVTDLILDLKMSTNTELDLTIFAAGLPSVTKLDFAFNSTHRTPPATIWTAWPALVSVRVRYNIVKYSGVEYLLDQLLTGVPFTRLDRASVQKQADKLTATSELAFKALAEHLDETRRSVIALKTEPALSDLKQLQEFRLVVSINEDDTCYDHGQFVLSELGGYLGLAMANPGLQRLDVLRQRIRNEPCLLGSDRSDNTKWWNKELLTSHCQELIRSAFHPYASINFKSDVLVAKENSFQNTNNIYPF